ncbi:MAG TPA: ABC transporter permease subunit [Bacillota bacterium]|nr:ABC transporter permease subunit [Bacillota bacterium]
MNRLIPLIYNELIKTYIRKSTWVMYGILALIIIGAGILFNFYGSEEYDYSDDNWRQELKDENESVMQDQGDPTENGDENVNVDAEFSMVDVGKNNYYLEHDIKPNPFDAWEFMHVNVGMLSIISLFTIIVAAGIVAHEFRWGTIKLLLIRPISRSTILLSKYISVLLFALFTLIFGAIMFLIVGGIFYGFSSFDPYIVINQGDGYAYVSQIGEILADYGYQVVNLVMMATFAFMISSIFRNSAMAIGVAIFLMFTGNSIVGIFANYDWAKYILFANTDLSQYANDATPWIEGMTIGFSIMMLIIYYVVFMVLSWIFFTKRDVAGQ